jgi:RHS repeat-associated protein
MNRGPTRSVRFATAAVASAAVVAATIVAAPGLSSPATGAPGAGNKSQLTPVAGSAWTHAVPKSTPVAATPVVTASVPAGSYSVAIPTGAAAASTFRAVGASKLSLATNAAGQVRVDVLTASAAKSLGFPGLALRLTHTGTDTATHTAQIRIPTSMLTGIYGRASVPLLRWVQVGATATAATSASAQKALTTSTAQAGVTTLTATITNQTTMVAAVTTPVAKNGSGVYSATSLRPTGTWQVSAQTGDFAWNYPIRVAPSASGANPDISLAYNSAAVDGETGNTNNQATAIGDGWSIDGTGFIERSFQSCASAGVTGSGDLCWKSDNATISFAGHSGTLVKDNTDSTGKTWRLLNDDGSRIQHLTSVTPNNGTVNDDEWALTTPDGTRYFFGLNRAPSWATGDAVTNSVWYVPVCGNATTACSGAYGHETPIANLAWRWNLDWVETPDHNTYEYYYTPEYNYYDVNGATTGTQYVRGGYLNNIDYGMRRDHETKQAAPERVLFDVGYRCDPDTTPPGSCSASNPQYWPDTPIVLYCQTATCSTKTPTFFSVKMTTGVHAQLYSGSGTTYNDVESWAFTQKFALPNDGDDDKQSQLWLQSISHVGHVSGTVTLPTTTFTPVNLQNRVDPGGGDPLSPFARYRIGGITTETGATITIGYSDHVNGAGTQCSATHLATSPDTNTLQCFPQWWTPQNSPPSPRRIDYFFKYAVTSVSTDPNSGAELADEYDYVYTSTPAYRKDLNPTVPAADRTWSDFAGYASVEVRHGDPNTPTKQLTTDYNFYRGLNGDPGQTAPVYVAGMITDDLWLAGQVYQSTVKNGVGGARVANTINTPWVATASSASYPPNITDGTFTTHLVRPGDSTTNTALSAGGDRVTSVVRGYDAYGRETAVHDKGDTATGSDDTCTNTTYVADTSRWMLNYPSTVTVNGCGNSSDWTQSISSTNNFYDNATSLTSAPTNGYITRVDDATTYNSAGDATAWTTTTTAYDTVGRVTSTTDPLGRTTTTAYVPETSGTVFEVGPVTQTTVTNPSPFNWTTVTGYVRSFGAPASVVDANAKRTDLTYDALGRLLQVWLPDHLKATFPSVPSTSYAYVVSQTTANSVATTTLTPSGGTTTSYTLYDGMGRQVQTQVPAEQSAGAVAVDTQYNPAGLVELTNQSYLTGASAPSGTLWVPATNAGISNETQTTFDGAGRTLSSQTVILGVQQWQTTYAYGGDHVNVTPPTGGTATTTYTDALGRTSKLMQYHAATPTGASDSTTYSYDHRGDLTGMVDPAGNHWSWIFDVRGRQTSATDPDTGTTTSAYDDANRVTSTTDSRGSQLTTTYDNLDRPTAEYIGTTSGTKLQDWTYDLIGSTSVKGQLVSQTRWDQGNAYTSKVTGYDAIYRPTGTSITLPNTASASVPSTQATLGGTYSSALTYNADGSLATQDAPAAGGLAAESYHYTYTNLGRLYSMTGAGIYLNTVDYDEIGRVLSLNRGNGAVLIHDQSTYFDGTDRVKTRQTITSGSYNETVNHHAYTYNDAGLMTSDTGTATGVTTDSQCYTYDYLQRLTAAWTPSSGSCVAAPSAAGLGGPAPYWTGYAYDLTGNRTGSVEHLTSGATITDTETYPTAGTAQPHAVTSVQHVNSGGGTTTSNYGYDTAGNTTARPGHTLTYTADGHVASDTSASGTQTSLYSPDGALLIQNDSSGTTVYLGDTVLHASVSGTVTGTRTYTTALTGPLTTRTATVGVSGNTAYWLASNLQGTTTETIDPATGTITHRYLDPFGQTRTGTTPPTWPDNRSFLNGTVNSTAATVHLGARDYDPTLGRFLSVDPVMDPGDPQQNNGYAYGWNNPINASDPAGTRPACADEGNCGGGSSPDVGDLGCGQYCGGAPPPGAPGSTIKPGGALTYSNPGAYVSQRTRQKYGCDYVAGTCLGFMATQGSTNEIGAYADSAYKDWADAWRDYDPVAFLEYEADPCGGSTTCKVLAILTLLIGVYATVKTPDASLVATAGKGRLAAAARGNRAAAETADGAANAANGVRLAQQLARESANSAFTTSGELTSGAIADSNLIIPGSKIGNPDVIKSLTSDGSSISDWGKYTTRTYQSPSGDFQVHYYMNRTTGAVNYGSDYKVVFNGSR